MLISAQIWHILGILRLVELLWASRGFASLGWDQGLGCCAAGEGLQECRRVSVALSLHSSSSFGFCFLAWCSNWSYGNPSALLYILVLFWGMIPLNSPTKIKGQPVYHWLWVKVAVQGVKNPASHRQIQALIHIYLNNFLKNYNKYS